MAIVIEEQKKNVNWFALAVVVLLVVVVGLAAYYLFFAPTPLVEKVAPPRLQSIQELSLIKLQPESVISNPNFQILKQYVNPIEIQTDSIGKVNPFSR